MQSVGGSQAAAPSESTHLQALSGQAGAPGDPLEDEQTGPGSPSRRLSSFSSLSGRPSKAAKAPIMTARKSLNAQVLAPIVAAVKRSVQKKSLEPFRVSRQPRCVPRGRMPLAGGTERMMALLN